jgi:NAD(P) transhydrogenase subunit alpha
VKLNVDFDAESEGGYARQLTDEEQEQQRAALADVIAAVDIVITTAQVPGKRAPLLVTEDAIKRMAPGSVIVDMAGDSGGNTALTKAGETVVEHGVTIVAPLNLPASMPESASNLYARNILALVELMVDEEGKLALDWSDEVIAKACVAGKQEPAPEPAAPTLEA